MKQKTTTSGNHLRGMLGGQEEEEAVNYDEFQEEEGWYKQFKENWLTISLFRRILSEYKQGLGRQ